MERGDALANAAEKGHLAIVEFLLQNGPIYPESKEEAIQAAQESGHNAIVKLLTTK